MNCELLYCHSAQKKMHPRPVLLLANAKAVLVVHLAFAFGIFTQGLWLQDNFVQFMQGKIQSEKQIAELVFCTLRKCWCGTSTFYDYTLSRVRYSLGANMITLKKGGIKTDYRFDWSTKAFCSWWRKKKEQRTHLNLAWVSYLAIVLKRVL